MIDSQANASAVATHPLQIDIPVLLDKANVVYNIDHLMMWGDMPFAIVHMQLIANHFQEPRTDGRIVAVFHSDAGHVMLNDRAYNMARIVSTGNPYKAIWRL